MQLIVNNNSVNKTIDTLRLRVLFDHTSNISSADLLVTPNDLKKLSDAVVFFEACINHPLEDKQSDYTSIYNYSTFGYLIPRINEYCKGQARVISYRVSYYNNLGHEMSVTVLKDALEDTHGSVLYYTEGNNVKISATYCT